jgi:hypothetical protein
MTDFAISVSVKSALPGIEAIIGACKGNEFRAPEFDTMRKQWTDRYETFVKRRFDDFGRGGGDWPALALSTIEARRGPAKGRKGKGGGSAGGKGARTSLARDTQRGGVLVGTGRTVTILRDTGMLRMALAVGSVGNYAGETGAGIEFGFDGTPHTSKADALNKKSKSAFAKAMRATTKKSYDKARAAGLDARWGARRAGRRQSATIADIARWHNEGTPKMPQRLILAKPDTRTATAMANDFTRAILAIGRRAARAGGGT